MLRSVLDLIGVKTRFGRRETAMTGPSPLEIADAFFSGSPADGPVTADRFADGTFDPFEIGQILANLQMLEDARRCLLIAAGDAPQERHLAGLAQYSMRLSDFDAARTYLDRADRDAMSAGERAEHDLRRIEILRAESRIEAALEALANVDFPSSMAAMKTRTELSLLAICDGREDEFEMKAVCAYAETRSYDIARILIDFSVRRNKGVLYLPLLIELSRSMPKRNAINETIVTIGWQLQDENTIEWGLERLKKHAKFYFRTASFAYQRRDSSTALARHVEFLRTALDHAPADPPITVRNAYHRSNLARVSAHIGEVGRALQIMEPVVERFPFLVNERLLLAEILSMSRSYARSEAILDDLLVAAPQNPSIYPLTFLIKNRMPDAVEELEQLLDLRARYIPRFRNGPKDAPIPIYDAERFQLELRKGRIDSALACRTVRPANRLVARLFPAAYRNFEGDLFADGAKYDRIGVIGWDGVSDEARWARYYPFLRARAKTVVASCEPRFLTLFQRSFPWIEFVPIRRRWPHLWGPGAIYRSGVQEQIFSGVVDENYLKTLGGCDLVMFSDEITYQVHRHHPQTLGGADASFGASYLVADPERVAFWRARLADHAGGRRSVGLIWRSGLRFSGRENHYLSLEDLTPLLNENAHFVSLQHGATEEERAFCTRRGVQMIDGVDLFNEFDEVAAIVSALDLMVGVSTLPFELAGALGTEVWMLAVSPQGVFQRRGDLPEDLDQLTLNGRIISPDLWDGDAPRSVLIESVVEQAAAKLAARFRPSGKLT